MVVGAVMMLLYFFMTRMYFESFAIDLFRTGDKERLVKGVLKALGNLENIKGIESDCFLLSVAIYDANKIDIARLKKLGASKVVETATGYDIYLGSTSTIVRKGIEKEKRSIEA